MTTTGCALCEWLHRQRKLAQTIGSFNSINGELNRHTAMFHPTDSPHPTVDWEYSSVEARLLDKGAKP